MMTINYKNLALPLFLLAGQGRALQVTPGSPCAAECLDNPNQDLATGSRTFGSDITCLDANYQATQVGKKYQGCVSCLQNSTATGQGQNDQDWFLYNLRYSLDACLFSFVNASDAKPSPCTTDASCGPLQTALQDGNLLPGNESEFSYCTADNNAFRGTSYPKCESCLRNTDDQKYLANFLTALDAGCNQRPVAGSLIGLQGTVFSKVPLNGTFAGWQASNSTKHGLPQGAIIGIAVGLAVLLLVGIAILFICSRKRQATKRLKSLHSPLDARFGANNITSPTDGAYGNPYSRENNQAIQPFDPSALSKKELTVLANARSVLASHQVDEKLPNGWQDAHAHLATALPAYTGATVPTHHAYIPTSKRDISPTRSTSTENTYQLSQYPSSRSSPKNIIPTSARSSPRNIIPASARASPRTSPKFVPPPITVPESTRNPPVQIQPRTSPDIEGSSRIMLLRGMHSQANQTPIEEERPHSRTGSWRRATAGLGLGNSNASTSQTAPMAISGPIVTHGGRFDFEMAEKERKQRERQEKVAGLKLKKDDTPVSADSDDMWPGAY